MDMDCKHGDRIHVVGCSKKLKIKKQDMLILRIEKKRKAAAMVLIVKSRAK